MHVPGDEPEFISEPITPEPGSFTTELMAQGLAALPRVFAWRGARYEIVECLAHHKQSAPEGGADGGERYLRRQVFDVRLDSGDRATIYMIRHAGRGKTGRKRWFLYTLESGAR
jgi:hypothetical protein